MQESQIDRAIALSIQKPEADAEAIAAIFRQKAVLKIGRMRNVDWNRKRVGFSLTSGKTEYYIGSDITGVDAPDLQNMQTLWRTDTVADPIHILPISEFNRYARGSSTSGKPQVATLHSGEKMLEIWPSPDSNYSLEGYARLEITRLEQIPEAYHDVVIDYAIAALAAAQNPAIAVQFAQAGLKDIADDSLTQWDGTVVPLPRHLGKTYAGAGADSGNLRGD